MITLQNSLPKKRVNFGLIRHIQMQNQQDRKDLVQLYEECDKRKIPLAIYITRVSKYGIREMPGNDEIAGQYGVLIAGEKDVNSYRNYKSIFDDYTDKLKEYNRILCEGKPDIKTIRSAPVKHEDEFVIKIENASEMLDGLTPGDYLELMQSNDEKTYATKAYPQEAIKLRNDLLSGK